MPGVAYSVAGERGNMFISAFQRCCRKRPVTTAPMWTPVEQLKAIIDSRKRSGAAMATMSWSELMDPAEAKLHRFQTLIGLMISAQTKDAVTTKAVENLQTLRGGLAPTVLANTSEDVVRELIRPVSFFRTKEGRIIRVAGICSRDYDGDIPRTIEALTALPGVGLKMATLAMTQDWGEEVGIGVDVHVHRIATRIGWVATNHPDKTEARIQDVFPKQWWGPLNEAIVGFGQTICNARRPKCDQCPIADSCKAARGGDIEDEMKRAKRKRRKTRRKSDSDDAAEFSDTDTE